MAATFVKEVICPGLAGDREISPEHCKAFFENVSRVHNEGLYLPLVLEHPPLSRSSSAEGWPMAFSLSDSGWEKEISALRGTIGNVVKDHPANRINERGGVELAFEVRSEDEAARFRDGTYKFVSPEIWPRFGDITGPVPTHFAVTHRPKQRRQAVGFSPVQFSDSPIQLGESTDTFFREVPTMAKGKQLSDNGESDKEPDVKPPFPPKAPEVNPDMPAAAAPEKDPRLDALVAQLSAIGLVMPADTNKDTLVERLLTACMTYNASKQASEKEPDKDDQKPMAAEETSSAMQFSEGSPQRKLADKIKTHKSIPGKIRKSMLSKLSAAQFSETGEEIAQGGMTVGELLDAYEGAPEIESDPMEDTQQALLDRIAKLLEDGKITPGVADYLRAQVGAVQMSDKGEPVGTAAVVVAHYEACPKLPGELFKVLTSATQLSETEQNHPDASFYTTDKTIKVGDPRAKAEADRILKNSGFAK